MGAGFRCTLYVVDPAADGASDNGTERRISFRSAASLRSTARSLHAHSNESYCSRT